MWGGEGGGGGSEQQGKEGGILYLALKPKPSGEVKAAPSRQMGAIRLAYCTYITRALPPPTPWIRTSCTLQTYCLTPCTSEQYRLYNLGHV